MFDISTEEALAVLYEMGTANLNVSWDDECTCDTDGDEPDPLADVKPGDPDPNALNDDDVCAEWGPDGLMCTRSEFHPGQHIAGNEDEVLAVWL